MAEKDRTVGRIVRMHCFDSRFGNGCVRRFLRGRQRIFPFGPVLRRLKPANPDVGSLVSVLVSEDNAVRKAQFSAFVPFSQRAGEFLYPA